MRTRIQGDSRNPEAIIPRRRGPQAQGGEQETAGSEAGGRTATQENHRMVLQDERAETMTRSVGSRRL